MDVDQLDYEFIEGKGTPLVFIHGWLGSKEFWNLIRPHLNLDNPLLFYNQRCYGNSSQRYDMEILVKDLENLIKDLDIEDPVLVGHSMGGMTALQYASDHSNLSALCLLATSASTPEPENKSVKYFLDEFDMLSREEWAEKITENYVGNGENTEIKEMTRQELIEANEKPIRDGLQAMMSYDVRDSLQNTEIRALVIAAENDGAITMEKSRELAELLNCSLETIDTSHQMLPEKPKKVADLIQKFVETEVN